VIIVLQNITNMLIAVRLLPPFFSRPY